MATSQWCPRSAFERSAGCVFLGRLIDKARRRAAGRAAGIDLMDGYMYGDNDYMDSRVLKFLNAKAADVDALVASNADDDSVARTLVERSGKSAAQLGAFNRRMVGIYGPVFVMFDADEGRRRDRFSRLLGHLYNTLMFPPFARKFAADERKAAEVVTAEG